ncbi:hypothetical protein [Faecalibaculum rodentium]|uniref:hypothetical protein n=2 Tax=Faecalibaculum rodentium TaxID=1702221 RepID=UPI0025A55131|nr:hypothetical protein [Faecalibaculum rodentium]
MITKGTYRVCFPAGAVFHENPSLMLYRDIMNYIRKLSCFNADKKCRDCPESGFCKYHQVSGGNFVWSPSLLVRSSVFYHQVAGPGEVMDFNFFFIGSGISFLPFIELFFQSHSHLHGIPMILKGFERTSMDETPLSAKGIRILTPVESADISSVLQEMVTCWNDKYQADISLSVTARNRLENPVRVSMPGFRSGGREIRPKGYAGQVKELELPAFALETGIGKWNFMGGGRLETESDS